MSIYIMARRSLLNHLTDLWSSMNLPKFDLFPVLFSIVYDLLKAIYDNRPTVCRLISYIIPRVLSRAVLKGRFFVPKRVSAHKKTSSRKRRKSFSVFSKNNSKNCKKTVDICRRFCYNDKATQNNAASPSGKATDSDSVIT